MNYLKRLEVDLKSATDPVRAQCYQRFFQTGKGQYGEGDIFLGLKVPYQRQLAKKYKDVIDFDDIEKLLMHKIHEFRFMGLLLMMEKLHKADAKLKKKIFKMYLKYSKQVNNWDLVDFSAPKIVGNYLLEYPNEKDILYTYAKSDNLWQRRIAIISTFAFIKKKQFEDTFKITEMLLNDPHDLIHKAIGWLLREVGKRDQAAEETFLQKHCHKMPRAMLRSAIERFEESKRMWYLRELSKRKY